MLFFREQPEQKKKQLRTYDWCKPPKRITLSKLALEVAKNVQKFIEVRPHTPLSRIVC